MIKFCLYAVYVFLVYCSAQIFDEQDFNKDILSYLSDNELEPSYNQHIKPEVIRTHNGGNITLKCNISCSPNDDRKITWEFLPCQTDFKNILCDNFYKLIYHLNVSDNSTWSSIKNNVDKRKCLKRFKLLNVTENNGGLYRCLENNTVIISAFQTEILTKYEGTPPKILDVVPPVLTISEKSPIAVIQCKVYSKNPPNIWWFKQSGSSNYDLKYKNDYYNRINTSDQLYIVPTEYNVYLSKLNIYNVRDVDGGVYVCVAMTEFGKDLKNIIIRVVQQPKTYTKSISVQLTQPMDGVNASLKKITKDWEDHTSFSLLFLIPLAFALIPITIWLCYYIKKKKNIRRNTENTDNEASLIKPVLHTNDITRNVPIV